MSQQLGLNYQMSPEVMYITPNIWQLGIIFISVCPQEVSIPSSQLSNWADNCHTIPWYGISFYVQPWYDKPYGLGC